MGGRVMWYPVERADIQSGQRLGLQPLVMVDTIFASAHHALKTGLPGRLRWSSGSASLSTGASYSVLSVEPWVLERRENSNIERRTGIFTRGRPCLRPSWISCSSSCSQFSQFV